MIGPLVLGFIAGLILGWIAMVLRRKLRAKRPYLAAIEFWVYLPSEKPPSQDELMTRMVRDNPYGGIGPAGGLLFSDVRLDMSLVLRSKNPHAFRPDVVNENLEISAEAIEGLARAQALLKVRYISQEPLKDLRHVQFLTHLALAAAELSGGEVICDVVGERLLTVSSLREGLQADPDAAKPDLHVRVFWSEDGVGGHAETRGLLKVGVPELSTLPSDADQRVLIQSLVSEAARSLWQEMQSREEVEVEAYGDHFRLQITPSSKGPYQTRILRQRT